MAARKKKSAKPVKRRKQATRMPAVDPRPKDQQGGRPSIFSRELGTEICKALSEGVSLRRACMTTDHFPTAQTVRRWMLGQGIPSDDLAWFRENYTEARRLFEDSVFDELSDVRQDTIVDKDHIALTKLWADNSKWSLARMNRAKYGDKTDIGLGGTVDAPAVSVRQAPTVAEMREALRIVDEVSGDE